MKTRMLTILRLERKHAMKKNISDAYIYTSVYLSRAITRKITPGKKKIFAGKKGRKIIWYLVGDHWIDVANTVEEGMSNIGALPTVILTERQESYLHVIRRNVQMTKRFTPSGISNASILVSLRSETFNQGRSKNYANDRCFTILSIRSARQEKARLDLFR